MKNVIKALRNFLFPSPDSPGWIRALPYVVLGALTIAFLLLGNYGWEYTNSSEFCGTTCHTMPPEYSAYLRSPHARVQCVECHIGRDAFATQITRKTGDLRHIILHLTGDYEYPIYSRQMRPAREACETCHFPEKFSDDSLRVIQQYANDADNTWTTIYLLMSTGGGSAREGLGFGIHWHIENPVYYFPTDELEQNIPFVRVENEDGSVTEYLDVSSGIEVSSINTGELVEMDCITCHNRITHLIPPPDEAINIAIAKGIIPSDLPFVVQESIALLGIDYATKAEGLEAMRSLVAVYEEKYPEVANSYTEQIAEAAAALEDIYNQYIFPDQLVNWNTHPNNLGHKDYPGCFRCHDGGHISEAGDVIRLECNICHSIPIVSGPNDLVTTIELSRGTEPTSHTSSNWMTLHGQLIDQTCESCHPTTNPEIRLTELSSKPLSDDSFCGNSACHGNVWTYAAFEEEALQPYLDEQLESITSFAQDSDATWEIPLDDVALTYTDLVFPRLAVCIACHSGDASGGLDLTTYDNLLRGGRSGPAVVPGDPDSSVLVQKQSSGNHYASFSELELAKIIEWILAGAPEK